MAFKSIGLVQPKSAPKKKTLRHDTDAASAQAALDAIERQREIERQAAVPQPVPGTFDMQKQTLYMPSAKPGERKQWTIWTAGATMLVEWGRVGCKLQTKSTNYSTSSRARTEARKLYQKKVAKGYRK